MSKNPDTTDFDVEPVDPARSAKLLQIHDVHTAWTARQLAAGAPFHPDEHPPHSDYNLHSPDLDADGAAEDDLANATAEILSGKPGSTAEPGEARRRLTGR